MNAIGAYSVSPVLWKPSEEKVWSAKSRDSPKSILHFNIRLTCRCQRPVATCGGKHLAEKSLSCTSFDRTSAGLSKWRKTMEHRSKCEYRRSISNANRNRIPVRSRRRDIGSGDRWAARCVGKSARAGFFSSMYNKRVSHPCAFVVGEREKESSHGFFIRIFVSMYNSH